MIDLLLACLALVAGPFLARGLRGRGAALYALDGFVLVAVAGLCLFHILPEAFVGGHGFAVVLAAIGFFLPGWVERTLEHAHQRAHRWILGLALIGLCLHAAMDGAGLGFEPYTGGHEHDHAHEAEHLHALDQAILLHRLPMGLLLWMTMVPLFGAARAWLAIGAMVVSTVLGYLVGRNAEPALDSPWLADFLALVAGGLLHVIVHQARPGRGTRPRPFWGGIGAILAAGSLAFMASDHVDLDQTGLLFEWWSAMYWPPVLLGGLLSLTVILRAWQRSSERPLGAGVDGLRFGVLTPVCSCGPSPLYEDQVGHGAHRWSAAVAVLSAHVLRPEAWLLLLLLAGWQFTLFALGWSVGSIALLGLFLGRAPLRGEALSMHAEHAHDAVSLPAREVRLDWLHFHAAWCVGGLVLLEWIGSTQIIEYLGEHRQAQFALAVMLIVLASILEIPAVASVFMLGWWMAFFGPNEVTHESAIGWLVAGPLLGTSVRRTVQRLHGAGTAWFLVFLTAALALLGWVAARGLIGGAPSFFSGVPSEAWMEFLRSSVDRDGSDSVWGPVRLLLAAVAVLATLASLLLVGPRGWLAQLFSDEEHEHAHHPGTPHEHTGHHHVQIDVAGEDQG